MSRSLRAALAAVVFTFVLGLTATAFAAPVPWRSVDVRLHAEQEGGMMLVTGDLATSTPLPAQVELAVPAGAKLEWIGEILGGPLNQDPPLEYTKTTLNGIDTYHVTLTKSRTAQIEVRGADIRSMNGSGYAASLEWTAAWDVPQVSMSVRIPAGATITSAVDGAELISVSDEYDFYTTTIKKVKAGDKLDLTFTFMLPTADASAGAAAPKSANTLLIFVAAIVLVAAVVIGIVAFRIARSGRSEDDAYDEDDEDDDEDDEDAAAGDDESADDADAADADAGEPAPRSAGRGRRIAITVALLVVFAGGAALVGMQMMKPKIVGDSITQEFEGGTPCVTIDVPIAAPAGSDPVDVASALFGALKPIVGINSATYNVKTSRLKVGFCESKTTEEKVRGALAPTGLVGPQAAPSTETTGS